MSSQATINRREKLFSRETARSTGRVRRLGFHEVERRGASSVNERRTQQQFGRRGRGCCCCCVQLAPLSEEVLKRELAGSYRSSFFPTCRAGPTPSEPPALPVQGKIFGTIQAYFSVQYSTNTVMGKQYVTPVILWYCSGVRFVSPKLLVIFFVGFFLICFFSSILYTWNYCSRSCDNGLD